MKMINASVISQNAGYYQFKEVGGKERFFAVPCKSVHYCEFPAELMGADGLKPGSVIRLAEKKITDEKSLFYPAHQCYAPKVSSSVPTDTMLPGEKIKVVLINTEEQLDALRQEFCRRIDRFDVATRNEALSVLSHQDTAGSCRYLRKLLNQPILSMENECVEYKSSFIHSSDPKFAGDYKYQLHELIKTLVAFANSETHQGTLLVGVTDDQQICGIENEFREFASDFNREKFTSMFVNLLKQMTNNSLWLQTKIEWLEIDSHLCARLDVKYQGDIVLYNASELYIRKESGTFRVIGQDLIDFIRNAKYEIGAK